MMQKCSRSKAGGFTLVELVIVIAVVACLGAVATPVVATYYDNSVLKITMCDICQAVKEAKALALLSDQPCAIAFNTVNSSVSLVSGRGVDGRWNTSDDRVLRSFSVSGKGGGLRFGYGTCGPVPGLAVSDDGVTFQVNNSMVCNNDMTSNAGTVYMVNNQGNSMALTANSSAVGYVLRRCTNGVWELL
ncbi:MAG: prepilin-type N-terminal cleavage/methylation domain-containing protein [Desulfuromonadaceae bacterium]|nr:prepilin-type N-terminal cleavage/methylation domain-containing protein [Desulfuromonadaceae bacterium]MDD2847850.1 prepilin-type N-terminal cleavage/methylation domain-containing protein [Desulfuromonadaceae bacterium]MDD4129605.1 prepilin-type N-terminal cleavage/methylation domain-containing protein [Desulfuromonadaceae bacterium]